MGSFPGWRVRAPEPPTGLCPAVCGPWTFSPLWAPPCLGALVGGWLCAELARQCQEVGAGGGVVTSSASACFGVCGGGTCGDRAGHTWKGPGPGWHTEVLLPGGSPVHPFVHPFAMCQSSVHSWRTSAMSSASHAWYFGSASSSQEARSVVGLPPAQTCICFCREAQLARGPEPRLNDPALPTGLLHSDGPSDLEEAWEGRAWLQV